ncbi:protein LYK5 [Fagus crenata]
MKRCNNPYYICSILLLVILLKQHPSKAQQPYVNNKQLNCYQDLNNITDGFLCNGISPSCQSYLTFRSNPPYDSAASIGLLLGSDPTLISETNNISKFQHIPTDKMIIIPVNCSCSGQYYQYNSSYELQTKSETYFLVANDTYQGLTTCQALIRQNPYGDRNLTVGLNLTVPLRCACPTRKQTASGIKYLLSYMITWGNDVPTIAESFGTDEKTVLDANELTTDSIIFPFTPLLVPLKNKPGQINNTVVQAPTSPPQLSTVPTSSSSSSKKKWVFVGVGIGAGLLLLLSAFLLWFFCASPKKKTQPVPPITRPSPSPQPHSYLQSIDNSWSVSTEGVRHVIESLTVYKFDDIEKATGFFNEANKIQGSVYRGSFKGDDAAVKVMKGDVSNEINLLKRINHTNIIRLSGFCVHAGNTYLVYEYAENGSVTDWLHSSKYQTSSTLVWKQRVQIAHDVADALNYLHNYTNPPYIHKNLKTSNILLDGNLRGKVSNFGLARTLENEDGGGFQLTRHVVGTHGYMAPEYIENGVITPKLDVFAFGVVMLELLSGREAIGTDRDGDGGEELLSASIRVVLEGDNVREKLRGFIDASLRHEYPLDLAFSMAQLAKNCVAHDLNSRPAMPEVFMTLSKIFSSSLDWDPSDELQRSSSLSHTYAR